MDVLVSIGRFSEMTRLSVKALRHYHHIGLLVPAEVDPQSGYRYYHVGQANQAEAIRVLRSLDMPLEEVADVLASDESEVVAKLLEHHRLRLQENLDHQQRMLAYLEQLINKETTLMPYEITVKDVPTINIASIRIHTGVATVGRDVPNAFGTLFAAGVEPAAPPLIVQHDVIDEATTGDIEVCVPVDEPFASSGEAVGRELEGGSVASTVHKGSYAEIPPAYHALTQWTAEAGREFAGPPREIYLTDPKTTPTAELLTEIQWPLC